MSFTGRKLEESVLLSKTISSSLATGPKSGRGVLLSSVVVSSVSIERSSLGTSFSGKVMRYNLIQCLNNVDYF